MIGRLVKCLMRLFEYLRYEHVDKQLHFLYSFAGVEVLSAFSPWYIAAGIILIAGVLKELLDSYFDWNDLSFDALGICLALMV